MSGAQRLSADEELGPAINVENVKVGQKYEVTTRETIYHEACIANEYYYLKRYNSDAHALMMDTTGNVVRPQHFIGTLKAKYKARYGGYPPTEHPLLVFHVEGLYRPTDDDNGNIYFLAYEPVITKIQPIMRAVPVAEEPDYSAGGGAAAATSLHPGKRRWTFR